MGQQVSRRDTPTVVHANAPVSALTRRLVCANSKFNVYFDHIVDPRGHEVKDYLIVAPKQQGPDLLTGVAILPLVGDKVGLLCIWRPAIGGYSWEIPHGFVEAAEDNADAAARELVEETGLVAGTIRSLGHITPDAGVLAARVHLYLASDCRPGEGKTGELGLSGFKLFALSELEAMIRTSEIQDALTLAAWCRLRLEGEDWAGSFTAWKRR